MKIKKPPFWLTPLPEFLPDRPFNPSLYPKVYTFSAFPKIVSSILPIGLLFILCHAVVQNKPINVYEICFFIFIMVFWYLCNFRFVFGYSVVLYADRIEINRFLSKKTVIPRSEILFFSRGGFCRNTAVCLVTKRNKFYIDTTEIDHYVVTHGEFERDRDFFDWFNTLEAKTDFPLQRLRDKAK